MPDEIEVVTNVPSESAEEVKLHAEATKALVVQSTPPADYKDIVVVASNPQQMQVAQQNLIANIEGKLNKFRADLADAEENLKIAKTRKWKRGPFETQVDKAKKFVLYYEKIKAALDAGYTIIPNFEGLDIFAIRTTRKNPKANVAKGGHGWVQPPNAQITNRPPLGEGRYVNADTVNKTWVNDITKPGDTEKRFQTMAMAIAFDDIDFPFHLAKPQILNSTAEAMKILAFDDIGVTPGRHIRRGDPMIIGRVHAPNHKIVSFLITWFVETKDI